MDIFEKYSSEILFEQPIKYLGVTIYPVLMKDVFVFYKCAGVLLINPLDFNDPKVASMSYLELVINLALFQEDFKKNFIDILCLTMHIVEDDIKINSFEEDEMVHYTLLIRQDNVWKTINGGMFTKIKNLICYQNGLEVLNLRENQDIAKAKRALAQQANPNGAPSIKDQVYSVAAETGIDIKEIMNWSINRFNEMLKACDRLIHYKIYRSAEMSGMVTFKGGSPVKSWLQNEESTEGKMKDINEESKTFGSVIK